MARWIWRGFISVSLIAILVFGMGNYHQAGPNGSNDGPNRPSYSLVRPAFAQSSSTPMAYFQSNAGFSAYAKLAPSSKQTLDAVSNLLFTQVIAVGDNWEIGKVTVTTGPANEPPSDLLVYVDTDSWVIVALPKGEDSASVFASALAHIGGGGIYCGNSGSGTTLELAIGNVEYNLTGCNFSPVINWYDWEFPNATDLAAGFVFLPQPSPPAPATKDMQFAIPSGATWLDASARAFFSGPGSMSLDNVTKDSTGNVPDCQLRSSGVIPLDNPFPQTGTVHTLTVSSPFDVCSSTTPGSVNAAVFLLYSFCGPYSITGTVWVDSNQNNVIDAGEQGFQGATMQVSETGATATTDASGNYSLGCLSAGSYSVKLIVPAGYKVTTGFGNGATITVPPSGSLNIGIAPLP